MPHSHHHNRRYYLQDIPLDEARMRYRDALCQSGRVGTGDGGNRPNTGRAGQDNGGSGVGDPVGAAL